MAAAAAATTAAPAAPAAAPAPVNLMAYLRSANAGDDLTLLLLHLESACKQIAAMIASPTAGYDGAINSVVVSSKRDAPKPLDLISNEVLKSCLQSCGKVAVIASEEEDSPVWLNDGGGFAVVVDPLDGSRNIDACIPTGTIFGVYRRLHEADLLPPHEKAQLNVLQRGSNLLAAGYALYSSATILCLSVGKGAQMFGLDRQTGEFLLTKPDLRIPEQGQIYSVNDARYHDWPPGLQRYIDNIRRGKGESLKKYSARYICSLVADVHRTLLYGGIAMNPRSHLRLVYEGNPLSYLVEQAGGRGSDGKRSIIGIQPVELHQRLPLFLGSPKDVSELESYRDVQQLVNPGYEV